MKLVPSLMHAGFISQKTFDGICKSFTNLVGNADQKLTEDECILIKTCCLEAVKAKWADKAKIKKENAQPHLENAFKQEPPVEELLASVDDAVEETF